MQVPDEEQYDDINLSLRTTESLKHDQTHVYIEVPNADEFRYSIPNANY